jgi:hypothetical protein
MRIPSLSHSRSMRMGAPCTRIALASVPSPVNPDARWAAVGSTDLLVIAIRRTGYVFAFVDWDRIPMRVDNYYGFSDALTALVIGIRFRTEACIV